MEKAGQKGIIPKMISKGIFKALDKNGDGMLDGDEAWGIFKEMSNKNKSSPNSSEPPNNSYNPEEEYHQPQAPNSNQSGGSSNNKYY